MIKALFFDIDGTLVSFRTHAIPASTIDALEKAHEAGVKIFIATGRPIAIIDNLDAIKHLIDGYVTTNGAYCFVGEETVVCTPIPDADVRTMARMSDELGFACVYVGEKHVVLQHPNELLYKIFCDYLNVRHLPENPPLDTIYKERIIQITPIVDEETERRLMPLLSDCISGRWHPAFTDITADGADKGRGIELMAARFGISIDETMAFGDGGNDIPMLRRAGVGVAMGNAQPAIQAEADYVTTSVDDDGVRNALLHWKVIS
ncbi:MAG TPA: Cof-type HAD-IIB family hydrolase [Bacteroides sp.]|nr:Cof-type HAD-IIB family hydrolase [Phocaeicola coprophilus]HBB07466.1 Cof-type HAD-IIB family hydrolase [Bacteroides sp.]